jgi:lipopolysaccharide/colanic/teichoic acid biosynthesis glycosyltransferase
LFEPVVNPHPDANPLSWSLKRTPGKRVLDLVVAAVLLIVLAPVMAIVAAMVCLDSPGAPFYRQQRIGRGGKPFTMWKFRSMRRTSSDDVHRQQALNWFLNLTAPDGFKNEKDPRITRVGKYLRRTSLDELPQLLNVFCGEMSLVGPRPMMPYDRPQYEPWHFEREAVRPGITGLWQVSGRDRLSAPQMMALDVGYVREWSLWLDLRILCWTPSAVTGRPRDKVPSLLGTDAHSTQVSESRSLG